VRKPFLPLGYALAAGFLPFLPRRVVWGLASLMGPVIAAFDRRGWSIGTANLRVLFGARLTPRRERILMRGCYRQAARVAIDSVWFARRTRARVAVWARMDAEDAARLVAARPSLAVSAHFGNWEMMLLKGGQIAVPLMAVVKRQWSSLITARLNALRTTLNVRVVFAEGALRPLLKHLREGGSAGLLIDQYTSPKQGGVWVDFAGLPAPVTNAAAQLARRTEATVFLIFPLARRDGRYDFVISAAMRPTPEESDAAFTQRMIDGLLRMIRRHPSQWMAMYPRWDTIPAGAEKLPYPFYGRVRGE
jgi:KDO2-lipid IV(A) lauroyltransferase